MHIYNKKSNDNNDCCMHIQLQLFCDYVVFFFLKLLVTLLNYKARVLNCIMRTRKRDELNEGKKS